jgi:hypothetical protein
LNNFTTEPAVFDPESFDPELMTEGLRPKGAHREKIIKKSFFSSLSDIISVFSVRSVVKKIKLIDR